MPEANPKPGVTIAMPFFNNAATLELSIRSLLNQSCGDYELLLCDDGSYDESLAIAHSFDDPRVICWSDGRRLGVGARLNECIDRARGPYMARMDADDIAYPNRLAQQMAFLLITRRWTCAEVAQWSLESMVVRSGASARQQNMEKSSACLPWAFPYYIQPGWVGSSGFAVGVTMRTLG
jgi:glycosyltransferase involved in cell wall biosynthesis